MSILAHEIVTVPFGDKALRHECYDVRIQVFVHEQGFPLDVEIDESVLGERFRLLFFNLITDCICFQIRRSLDSFLAAACAIPHTYRHNQGLQAEGRLLLQTQPTGGLEGLSST